MVALRGDLPSGMVPSMWRWGCRSKSSSTVKVQRGHLGITIQEVNQSLADSFGLSKPGGALVSGVENGSPAAKAGVEPGDVILSLNGKEVVSSNELPPLVAAIPPGDTARLQVWRNKVIREIEVKVGGQKEEVGQRRKQGAFVGRAARPDRALFVS